MAVTQEAPVELSDFEVATRLRKAKQEFEAAQKAKENLAGRNEFMRGVVRGTDQLQATYQGGMGMVNALVGNDAEAARRFSNYQDEMRQSTENPATVDKFFSADPKSGAMASAGNMATWAAGTAGSLIPSVAESVVSGVAGGVAGGMLVPGPDPTDVATVPVGALAGMFGKGVVKKAIAEAAEQYVKQGVKREAAEQMATQAVRNVIAKRTGATVAAQQTTALNEGGGMYMEGREKGYDNPASAMALGQISGASEVAFGVFPASLRMVFKKAGVDEVAKKSGIRAAAGYAWDIAKNPLEEGAQEAFQEGLGSINESINDPKAKLFTKENFMKWAESAAAGALGGSMFGAGGAAVSAYQDRGQQPKTPPGEIRDSLSQNAPPQSPPTQPEKAPTYNDVQENPIDPVMEGLSPEAIQRLGELEEPPKAHKYADVVHGDRRRFKEAPKPEVIIQQWENARAAVTGVATQDVQDQGVPDDADAIVAQQLARRQAAKAGVQPPITTEAPAVTPTEPQATPAVQGVDWNAIATAGTESLVGKAKVKEWSDEEFAKLKSDIADLAGKATQGDQESQDGLIAIAKELEAEKSVAPTAQYPVNMGKVRDSAKAKPIGQGGNASVYGLDDASVLRVPKGVSDIADDFKPVDHPLTKLGIKAGQAIAENSQGVKVLQKQSGEEAGLALPKLVPESERDSLYSSRVKKAAAMPQSAYDELANTIAQINKAGYGVDPSKSSNILIDSENGKFNLVDLLDGTAKEDNGANDLLVMLMGNTYFSNYKGEPLTDDYRKIYDKVIAAARKSGLSEALSSSGEWSREKAGLPKPAEKVPPVEPPKKPLKKDAALPQAPRDGEDYFEPKAVENAKRDASEYKSRTTVINMSPDQFLQMAERLGSEGAADISQEKVKTVSGVLSRGEKFNSIPHLSFEIDSKTGNAKVVGHEGRHRAMELKKRGVKSMPVTFRGPIRWDQQKDQAGFDRIKQWPKSLKGETEGEMPFPVNDPLVPKQPESKNRDTVSQNPKPEPKKGGDPNAKVETEGQTKAQTETEAKADGNGLLGSKGDQAAGEAPSPEPSVEKGLTEGFKSLPPHSQAAFEKEWNKDGASIKEILFPTNKNYRAEFEARTGIKLPKTAGGTFEAVEKWNKEGRKLAGDAKPVMPKWEQGVTDLLNTVPAFKGASFELSEANQTVKVIRPDGRETIIHFNADEKLDATAKKRKLDWVHGAYIFKSGKKNDGSIYLHSKADHVTVLNHEVVHWLEDEGIITPAEVEKYGGREGIADAYAEWAATKARPANTLFEKIYDFLESFFDVNAKFFKELTDRVSPEPKTKPSESTAANAMSKDLDSELTSMIDRNETQARKGEGGQGLAVGAEYIGYRWNADAIRDFRNRLRKGESPQDAAEAVKKTARGWIEQHNARRPKDVNWARWEGAVDSAIESAMRIALRAKTPTPPQSDATPATEGGISVEDFANIFANPERPAEPPSKKRGPKAPSEGQSKEPKPRSVKKDRNKGVDEGLKEAKEGADLILKGLKSLGFGDQLNANVPINADIARGLGMLANGLIKAGKYKFAEFLDETIKMLGAPAVRYLGPYLEAGWNKKAESDSRLDKAGKVTDYLERNEKSDKEPKSDSSPQTRIARRVSDALENGEALTGPSFFAIADEEIGGKRSNNDYGDSEATDALELGVNMYFQGKTNPNVSSQEAKDILEQIKQTMQLVPRHRGRTGNKEIMQQFSTPPAYAYAVNWIANVADGDVVLEPSAGMGGLAIHAANSGATVYANELDAARAKGLRELPIEKVFTEDAEQIGAILAGKTPGLNVIIMNPPFSRAGTRMGDKMMQGTDRKHIDEALLLLPDGGRLVAIVGAGLHGQGKKMTEWLDGLPYRLTANIEVAREVYRGYGTEFPTRVLVIDKVPRANTKTITGLAGDLEQLIDIAAEVRDARQNASMESAPNQQDGEQGINKDGDGAGSTNDALDPVDSRIPESTEQGERSKDQQPTDDRGDGDADAHAGTGAAGRNTRGGRRGGGGGGSSRKPRSSSRKGKSSAPAPGKPNDALRTGLTKFVAKSRSKASVKKGELTDSTFEVYVPTIAVEGARPHPAPIVESAAMAAVDAPRIEYEVNLMPGVFEGYVNDDNVYVGISDIQLEAIALAGAAHEQLLSDGKRRGFLIGDGTGVGKAREALGIIMDDLIKRGVGKRRKAVFITKNDGLVKDAVNEWVGVGGDPSELHPLSDVSSGEAVGVENGVLTVSYDTLKGEASLQARSQGKDKSRVDQIIDWVGEDFDGVIVFDEAHLMANSLDSGQGTTGQRASQRALAGVDLQTRLPNARFVYLSATAATEVRNLAYAERLGLWGPGTEFTSKYEFINEIEAGGVAAMEKVAADMKAMGMYTARNLSFDDGTENGRVEFDRITHTLADDQRRIYDKLSEAWLKVLQNIDAALELTDNPRGKSRIISAFWSSNQRFWNDVISSMMAPTLITNIEKDLKEGKSVILQLYTTKEAATNRAIAGMQEGQTYDEIDASPRRSLMEFVEKSFPTQRHEEYTDESGNVRTRPVVDSEGKAVHDPKAMAMKEKLLDEIGSLDVASRGPIDIILDRFGKDMVAEVSGRSQRLVKSEEGPLELEKRGKASSRADREAFMDGRKRILIFSEAGGTGASYHASLSAQNQQRRSHYLWQPGWSATTAVQGLGRAHRSNQASAPKLHLLEPNLEGYKRFISTVARRLAQLGALTKGQRTAADAGLFGPGDNLESTESSRALSQFLLEALMGRVDGIDKDFLVQRLGFEQFLNPQADPSSIPIPQFLNRILNLPLGEQNRVFKAFVERFDALVAEAVASGTLDQGMETLKAVRIVKSKETVVNEHPSGAKTKLVELVVTKKQVVLTFDDMMQERERYGSYQPRGFVVSKTTGRISAVMDQMRMSQDEKGRTTHDAMLIGVNGNSYGTSLEQLDNRQYWEQVSNIDSVRAEWDKQAAASPKTVDVKWRLLTGALLPVWKKIASNERRVWRAKTEDGEMILGRYLSEETLARTLEKLGVNEDQDAPKQITKKAAVQAVYEGHAVELVNGWQIKKKTIDGEDNIEILGPDYSSADAIKNAGGFSRRIDYTTRYFIPFSDAEGLVLGEIAKISPIKKILYKENAKNNLSDSVRRLPETLYQTDKPDDVNPSTQVQAFDIAWAAEDAGIKTFDQLVSYSVKTVGERRTREIGGMLGLAAKTAGFEGVRPIGDILGVPGVTKEQAATVAKAAFPNLSGDQIEAGVDILDRLGLLDKIGFAPFGSPTPEKSLNQKALQTNTPEFRKWFGDSKVVGDDGKPMVVYHGTNSVKAMDDGRGFDTFEPSTMGRRDVGYFGKGFYFSPNPVAGEMYAGYEPGARILPVYLNIQNPYVYKRDDRTAPPEVKLLKEQGYDGIFVMKEWDGKKRIAEIVAFDSTQIKSSTGNQGTFDPANPNILMQNQTQGVNVKGWTSFISATRAIIGATDKADVSTFIHEIAHPMRRFLLNRDVPQNKRANITDNEISMLEKEVGVNDGVWEVEHEERFAKMWERYWFEGKPPKNSTPELESLFKKISQWMQGIYKAVQQIIGKPLPKEVRDLFDKLVQRGEFRDSLSQNENRDSLSQNELEETTSIKNEKTNARRFRDGIPALADVATETQDEWLDAADAMLQDDPMVGDRLVKEINTKARNLSNVEVAVMQIHYRGMNNRLEKVSDKLFAAKDANDPAASAKALIDVDIVMNALVEIEEATKAAGREWGRAGVARQIELNKDFSRAAIMRKARIANGGNALSEKQLEDMNALARKVAELEGKLAKAVQEKLDLERRKNVEAQIEDSKGKVQPVPESIRKRVSDKLNAFKSKFASAFASSSKTDSLFATEDEDMADDAKSVIQEYVDTMGVSSLGELLANLRKDLGSDIPVSVQSAFTTAWKEMSDNGDIPVPMVDKSNVRGLSRLAKQIERSLVEAGITDLDEVVRGVHESLQEIIPDITPRETMDAMSGYGQYSAPSDNPDDKIIADINGRLLELAKLDDMEAGIAPARTGVGRQPLSPEHRELIRKVNIAKRDGNYRVTDPDTQLKSAVESAKTALINRIHDLKKAIGPPSSPIVSSAKKDLAGSDEDVIAYRKERDELTAIYKTLFPKPGATMEQRIAATARALDRVADSLEKQMETKNFETKKKLEPISTEELDAKRARIDALRAQREGIAEYKEWNDEQKSKAYKANLLKQIADYKDKALHSYFGPKPKKEVRTLSKEEIRLGLKLQEAKDEFFRLAGLYRLENMSPTERAWDYVKETMHLSRAVMTSIDFSAVFRQGGAVAFSHPKMAAETSMEMYRAMRSAASEFETAEKMRRDDMYQFAMTAKLSITAEDGKITKQEEAFMGRWAKRIGLVAGSARGYTTFMNGIRFSLFKHMVANLGKGGQVTADEAAVIAMYINAATGRSELGPMMKWAEQANMLFFAPRFVASRFQYLGMPLWLLGSRKVSGRVKKAIAMEYIRHSAGVGSFLALTVALGALLGGDDEEEKPTVSLDPRSSDFLKIKLGETRIDPMSGLSQVIVLMGRIASGQRTGADGTVVDLRGENVPYGGLGMAGTVGNFVRTKFAPVPGAAFDIATGENVVGQDVTPFSAIVNLFIPLSLREIKDTAESRGIPQASLIALMSLHGMGSSTYGPESNYRKGTPEIREKQFKKDIRKITFDSKDPKYKGLLSEEQMTQVAERREDLKQSLVFSAASNPIRKDFKNDETYGQAVKERDTALENLKKSGLTLDESRKLLINHWESSYGGSKEMRKGVRVYKEALSDRLKRLRRVFEQ